MSAGLGRRRRGVGGIAGLVAVGVATTLLAFVVATASGWTARGELQDRADAAALAAAKAWLDARVPFDDSAGLTAELAARADAAVRHAAAWPPGRWREPLKCSTEAWFRGAEGAGRRAGDVEAVAVALQATSGALARGVAKVRLERRIAGFRPVGSGRMPLAPVALLCEPRQAPGMGWESQVERPPHDAGQAPPEFLACLAGAAPNAVALAFGKPRSGKLAEQLELGLAAADVAEFGGAVTVHGAAPTLAPACPLGAEGGAVAAGLRALAETAAPRVWLLGRQARNGKIELVGAVGATVASVDAAADGRVAFALRPCMLATAAAIAVDGDPEAAGRVPENPYLRRLRLAN